MMMMMMAIGFGTRNFKSPDAPRLWLKGPLCPISIYRGPVTLLNFQMDPPPSQNQGLYSNVFWLHEEGAQIRSQRTWEEVWRGFFLHYTPPRYHDNLASGRRIISADKQPDGQTDMTQLRIDVQNSLAKTPEKQLGRGWGVRQKHNCLCILFIVLTTTCFGHRGPSSGHRNIYRGKLYRVWS